MKYMGSKSRLAKEIVPIIQDYIDKNYITKYLEPFVGGANIIDKIKCEKKFASDNQKYLIALFNNLNKINELPEDFVTKELYNEVRTCYNKGQKKFEDWYIGGIGFLSSYNGRFFDGGYNGDKYSKDNTQRNYYREAKNNLISQIPNLKDINFKYCSYLNIKDIKNYLIYCDPPYYNTKFYDTSKNFNHDDFWNWVREKSKNNIVLVSEQVAPLDFNCIWEQEIKRTINTQNKFNVTEKIFIKK